jgi:hypothetical protein
MSALNQRLYALFAQLHAANLPLQEDWFADGAATKWELVAMIEARLRAWAGHGQELQKQ